MNKTLQVISESQDVVTSDEFWTDPASGIKTKKRELRIIDNIKEGDFYAIAYNDKSEKHGWDGSLNPDGGPIWKPYSKYME